MERDQLNGNDHEKLGLEPHAPSVKHARKNRDRCSRVYMHCATKFHPSDTDGVNMLDGLDVYHKWVDQPKTRASTSSRAQPQNRPRMT